MAVVIGKSDSLLGRFFTLAEELVKYHGMNEVDRQNFWNTEVRDYGTGGMHNKLSRRSMGQLLMTKGETVWNLEYTS